MTPSSLLKQELLLYRCCFRRAL